MRVLLQRVSSASVTVNGEVKGAIGPGILLLLGVHQSDTPAVVPLLAQKTAEMRIFPDESGKMNLSAKDTSASALVVSQFTLYGDCRKGRRPNFMEAAPPQLALSLYEVFISELRKHLPKVETGIFGAMMQVALVNDGPVTILLESPSSEPGP